MKVEALKECVTVCRMFLEEAEKQLKDHDRRFSGRSGWHDDQLVSSAGSAGVMTAWSKVLSQALIRLRKNQ